MKPFVQVCAIAAIGMLLAPAFQSAAPAQIRGRAQTRRAQTQPALKTASQPAKPNAVEKLDRQADLLRPLHKKLDAPKPGEWLAEHPEKGQTFVEYQKVRPAGLGVANRTIYLAALGPNSEEQDQVMRDVGEFLAIFYGMKVEWIERLPESVVPATARRDHPRSGALQFDSIYIVQKLLPPRVPRGAAALVVLTATDLWPGNDWNFVFGQGSLGSPTGVVSLARLAGDVEGDNLLLLRAIKIATHETGHLFGIPHCTAYECCMNGCNSLAETDRHPLPFCPECEAKIWLVSGADPVKRYSDLATFARRHGFEEAEKQWTKSAEVLTPVK
ncbi:MAG TPA: hypothetical protein VGJ26_05560 [Pirellulales bacterium]|jgi:archaemetzincin